MAQERRRRKTREQAKAETRQALIVAAAEVFSLRGFHGASLDEVAEHAGYTKGAVYANFEGKDDLYLAVLESHLKSDNASYWTEALENGAPVASIAAQIEESLPRMVEETRSWAMLTLEFFLHALRNEEVRLRLAELISEARQEYIASLRRRQEKLGRPMPLSPEQLGDALMALENGMSIFTLINPATLESRSYTATLARLLDS